MEAKIFVIEIPTVMSLLEKVSDLLDGVTDEVPKSNSCCCKKKCHKHVCDSNAPMRWEIGGKEADENLRFGYGLEVDEPMASNYQSRREFLRDHELYDNFVDAGEACRARGLDKRGDAPITKCNAIRQRVDEVPPMNIDLLGETDWWDEDLEW